MTAHRLGRVLAVGVAVAGAAFLAACSSRPLPAHDPDRITVGLGFYDVPLIAGSHLLDGTMWLEWRGSPRPPALPRLRPVVGVETNTHRDLFLYAGACADFPLGGGLHLVPGFAPGFWAHGHDDSKDLGSSLEFRSSLEIAYQFSDDVQVGLSVQHVSNANLTDLNPGADRVVLTVGIPVGRRTAR